MGSIDELAHLMGYDGTTDAVSLGWGIVIEDDGDVLQCLYKGATVEAAKACNCGAGDLVALELQGGQARAIAVRGGTRYATDSTDALNKQLPAGAYNVARLLKAGGRSVKFNQLVATEYRTITATNAANMSYPYRNSKAPATGHKILCAFDITPSVTPYNALRVNYGGNIVNTGIMLAVNIKTRIENIGTQKGTAGGSSYDGFYLYPNSTTDALRLDFVVENFQLFDLTAIYGAGNEPTTVEQFRADFPDDYYPYQQPNITNCGIVGVESVGKNLFTQENSTQNKYLNSTGAEVGDSGWNISMYIRVKPNTEYVVSGVSGNNPSTVLYDVSKAYIKGIKYGGSSTVAFTTDALTEYVRVSYSAGSTNVQLEEGSTATPYEIYDGHSMSIHQSVIDLCPAYGAGSGDYSAMTDIGWTAGNVANTKDGDVFVKRVGRVAIGDLNWVAYNTGRHIWQTTVADLKSQYQQTTPNIVCEPYNTVSNSTTWTDGMISFNSTTTVCICDIKYGNADEFKQAMQNVYIYYELAMPVRFTYNYIDFEHKKYVQNVGSVDLGSLTWITSGTQTTDVYRMQSNNLRSTTFKPPRGTAINAICSAYEAKTADQTYSLVRGVSVNTTGDLLIYDADYSSSSSPAAFKTAMSGVLLNYELATPNVVDLSGVLPSGCFNLAKKRELQLLTNSNLIGEIPNTIEYIMGASECYMTKYDMMLMQDSMMPTTLSEPVLMAETASMTEHAQLLSSAPVVALETAVDGGEEWTSQASSLPASVEELPSLE